MQQLNVYVGTQKFTSPNLSTFNEVFEVVEDAQQFARKYKPEQRTIRLAKADIAL